MSVLALPMAPSALGAPWETDRRTGVEIPAHLADHPFAIDGFAGWLGAPSSHEPILISNEAATDVDRGAWWSAALGRRF